MANATITAPTKAEAPEQYVCLEDLTVWARKPPHEWNRPHSCQTLVVARGEVLRLGVKHWLGEDDEEQALKIEHLLAVGSIARKADVDSGEVIVPAESAVDETGNLRPVEERPVTLLARINRTREMDRQPRIETVKVNGRPLLDPMVQPFAAPPSIVSELVPAAKDVH
jgi:hypothetical protein